MDEIFVVDEQEPRKTVCSLHHLDIFEVHLMDLPRALNGREAIKYGPCRIVWFFFCSKRGSWPMGLAIFGMWFIAKLLCQPTNEKWTVWISKQHCNCYIYIRIWWKRASSNSRTSERLWVQFKIKLSGTKKIANSWEKWNRMSKLYRIF